MYELRLLKGAASVRRREFRAGPVRIGRDPEAEVAIAPDPEISRRHARLEREEETWVVHDDGSANGTFVNDVRLTAGQDGHRLADGDRLALGSSGQTVFGFARLGDRPSSELCLTGEGLVQAGLFESMLDGAEPAAIARVRDRMFVLYEASRAVFARIQDFRQLLDRIKEEVVRALNVDEMIVAIKEPGGEVTFEVVNRRNRFRSVEIAGSRKVIAQVLETGRTVWLDPEEASSAGSTSIIRHHIRTAMCVPLVFRSDILGAIYVQNPERGGAFTPADFDFLAAFASQAAIAVHSARHAEERTRALEQLRREQLRTEGIDPRDPLGSLVGESEAIRSVKKHIEVVKDLPSSVLIQGESGTGKELVAKAIHYGGVRRDRPFVSVSVAAFAGGVLESELFGHEKGAFTGAVARKAGKFELAHLGTLFLDEIGEVPLPVQVKFLRVLQERSFERVGGNQPVGVDVRFVFATNRDLLEATRKGEFREDLYYRVAVVPIYLPPLRERRDDIPMLVTTLVARLGSKLGMDVRGLTDPALQALLAYDFPGNIRELENLLEHAFIRLKIRGADQIDVDDLPVELRGGGGGAGRRHGSRGVPESYEGLRSVERDMVLKALHRTGWNKRRAAQLLGITHQTLYARIEEFSLTPGEE